MNATMEAGAGIYRTDESLRRSCAVMNDIRRRYASIELADKSNVYNTDLIQTLELGAMIDVADLDAEVVARKAMAIAAEICVYTNGNVTVECIDDAEEPASP